MKKFLAGFLMGDCAPLDFALKPLLLLAFRLYVAYDFFLSGKQKLSSWSSTVDLFKYEYNVPLISPELAAYLATAAELVFPVLLVFGFITRPAALGLFVLNIVAAMSLAQTDFASAAGHWQHMVWGTMLATVFVFGPGTFSLDKIISNKWKNA